MPDSIPWYSVGCKCRNHCNSWPGYHKKWCNIRHYNYWHKQSHLKCRQLQDVIL